MYWIDEILITSTWKHAQEWTNHILEFSLYRESAAAIRFFEKANEAEKRDSTDPLEVFFLCVALGFRGELSSDEEELRRWASRVHERITEATEAPRAIHSGAARPSARARATALAGRATVTCRQPARRSDGRGHSGWLHRGSPFALV